MMGRAPRITVNGVTSGWQPVTSGVSQGSILGPVLFNVFISDLDTGLEAILGEFADDTKLGTAVKSLKVRKVLKRYLDQLEDWAVTKWMKFNNFITDMFMSLTLFLFFQ